MVRLMCWGRLLRRGHWLLKPIASTRKRSAVFLSTALLAALMFYLLPAYLQGSPGRYSYSTFRGVKLHSLNPDPILLPSALFSALLLLVGMKMQSIRAVVTLALMASFPTYGISMLMDNVGFGPAHLYKIASWWQAIAAACGGTIGWLLRFMFIGKKAEEGHCLNCNYDLVGLSASRCPECGWELDDC